MTEENKQNPLIKIGSLWTNSSKNGVDYLNGDFQGNRILVFDVEQKTKEGSPSKRVVLSTKKTDDKPNPDTLTLVSLWEAKDKNGNPYYEGGFTESTKVFVFANTKTDNAKAPSHIIYLRQKQFDKKDETVVEVEVKGATVGKAPAVKPKPAKLVVTDDDFVDED
jgi:hypothetical protein